MAVCWKESEILTKGRPFQLGSLYNSNSKALLKKQLWNEGTLIPKTSGTPKQIPQFKDSDESLSAKVKLFDTNGDIKSKIYDDLTPETLDQAQYAIPYQYIFRSESIASNYPRLDNPRILDDAAIAGATHVVTSVSYGLDGLFIFEYDLSDTENFDSIYKNMELAVKDIPKSVSSNKRKYSQSDINFVRSIKCSFYGECQIPVNISKIEDVENILRSLKGAEVSSSDIPIIVGLSPINKFLSAVPDDISKIAEDAITKLESMEMSLQLSSDVASQLVTVFASMQPPIEELCETVIMYKEEFISKLNSSMISACEGDATKLNEVIVEHNKSPFCSQVIHDWIREKQKELCSLRCYIDEFRKIPDIKFCSQDECESFLQKYIIKYDRGICFEFHMEQEYITTLKKVGDYLKDTSSGEKSSPPSKPWYSMEAKKAISKVRDFTKLASENSGSDSRVAFFVVSILSSDNPSEEPAKIVEYEDGGQQKQEITQGLAEMPSSKINPAKPSIPKKPDMKQTKTCGTPGKPYAIEKEEDKVTLVWETPEGHDLVKCYVVCYRKINEKTQSEIETSGTARKVTISKLEPNTRYIFHVIAKCKSGIDVRSKGSDPIETVHVIKEKVRKKISGKPGKPEASKIGYDKIKLKWSAPKRSPENVAKYQILYQAKKDSSKDWHCITTKDASITEIDITDLIPNTGYTFKVAAQCESGISDENASDTIITANAVCSAPGKPIASQVNQDRIKIQWDPPDELPEMVQTYYVSYSPAKRTKKWVRIETEDSREEIAVHQLQPDTPYVFKVTGKCKYGDSKDSPESDDIRTLQQVCGPPDKPKISEVTKNSITINWSQPSDRGNLEINQYHILYRILSSKWRETIVDGKIETKTFTGLTPNTEYEFKVKAKCSNGTFSEESEVSNVTKTRALKIADSILPKVESHLITSTSMDPKKHLAKYRVDKLLEREWGDTKKGIVKYSYGKPTSSTFFQSIKAGLRHLTGGVPRKIEEKVLLIVGATGAGKSTLINGIVNYIFGVEFEDKYRFKLIHDETTHSQAFSQTDLISVYTFHWQEGFPFPYTITIIDTPGFGDTRGLVRDKKIVAQIKNLFELSTDKGGIEVLHGIGFVIQASLARLTPTQQYIFDSILAVFGNDVIDNISIMATFADGAEVQVMSAIEAAGVPQKNCFKFNNSALFSTTHDNFSKMFWQMGAQSFKEFFDVFGSAQEASLQLTKEVLREREQMEAVISGLQQQLHLGLSKMEELNTKKKVLQEHEADIKTNKNFTVTVKVDKHKKVDLDTGIYVTNCLTCNMTCHYPCKIPNDEDKSRCGAMKPQCEPDAHCVICPGKCHWEQHVNNSYRFELYEEEITETYDDLKAKYMSAEKGKNEIQVVISGIQKEMNDIFCVLVENIQQLNKCITRLGEIALKPNHLTDVQYIDVLIESEKQQAKEGYLDRIKYLSIARQKAALLIKIASGNENIKKEDLTFDLLSDWSQS